MSKKIENLSFIDKITAGLNEQQAQAVKNPLNYCTKIVAGAGTGKTKIISKRFVKLANDLIEQNIDKPVERLLVITFTDKAAGEMKGRIVNELKDNEIDYLGQELWISTFHSFCSKILRKHSIEVGLSPSFEMGEEKQLSDIYNEIITKIRYGEASTVENINETAAQLGLESSMLDIKSINKLNKLSNIDSLLEDILNVIKKIKAYGLSPKEFLDKTLKANYNYSEAVKSIPFGLDSKDAYAEAWNEHLNSYTDDSCDINGKVFDKIAGAKLVLDKLGKRKASDYGMAEGFPEKVEPISELEEHLTKVIALIYALYQKELEAQDLVDFDDLINKTIQVLKQNELIRLYYQKLFKHIIIDEFQDTNGSQLELIKLLLDENEANITFVGDRKQSIYAFRFAQMENLEVLHDYVENKYSQKYEPIQLEYNYRSTPHVLDAVNYVTTEQLELEEVLNPNPYKTFEEENKHVKVTPLAGFENAYEHRLNEANYIASEVLRLKNEENAEYKDFAILVRSHNQAETIDKQLSKVGIPAIKKVNLGFFADSVMKNALALIRLAGNIRDELALFKVLKIKLSDGQIYQLKKQVDAKILETKDFKELKRMNLSDKFSFIKETSSFDTLKVDETSKKYVSTIFETVNTIQKQQKVLSLLQVYYKLINEIKPYSRLSGVEQYKAELNLRVFEKIIADFMQSENYVSIKKFIEYIERVKEDRGFELPTLAVQDVNAVQILTVHASKGLEFPYTFLTSASGSKGGAQDGSILSFDLQYGDKPGFGIIANKYKGKSTAKALIYKEIWSKPRQKSEDLRLFYVAVSRAEKYLNILSFEPYGNNGTIKPIDYIKDFKADFISKSVDMRELKVEKQELSSENILPANIKTIFQEKSCVLNNSNSISHRMNFSQINTFNHCPNKYLYKYKFKYPELVTKKDSSLVGHIVHNLIYSSYMSKKALNSSEIAELLNDITISEKDLNRINSLYGSFLDSEYSPLMLQNKNIFSEKSFDFIYKLGEKELKFSGDIDLLKQNEDNTYSIIDFKTNKQIENSLDDYYKQLYLYKMAMISEGLSIKEAKLVNLLDNSVKEYYLEDNKETLIQEALSSEIEVVLNTEDIETKEFSQNCIDCGYGYLCSSS